MLCFLGLEACGILAPQPWIEPSSLCIRRQCDPVTHQGNLILEIILGATQRWDWSWLRNGCGRTEVEGSLSPGSPVTFLDDLANLGAEFPPTGLLDASSGDPNPRGGDGSSQHHCLGAVSIGTQEQLTRFLWTWGKFTGKGHSEKTVRLAPSNPSIFFSLLQARGRETACRNHCS